MRTVRTLFTAAIAALATAACNVDDRGDRPALTTPVETALKQPLCGVFLSGPAWVVEGDVARVMIGCSTGRAVPPDLTVDGLPAGAQLDLSAGEITWTTGLADAGVYALAAKVPSDEADVATFKLGVVDRFDAPGNTPPDPIRYTEEYGLPVFHLEVTGMLSADTYTPVSVTYAGHRYDAQAKYRGMMSLTYPKKSYTLWFPDADRFTDAGRGFTYLKKLLLVTMFDDQTFVRNRLVLDLWKKLGSGHIGVRTASAVVYVNGQFMGVYMMSEKINAQLLADNGVNKNGNLYNGKLNAANFYAVTNTGVPKTTWHDGFEKAEGYPPDGEPGAYDDLDLFVRFVVESDDATFGAQFPNIASLDEYRDWWALVRATRALDNQTKNVFYYHDPAGGLWRTFPWDCSPSFGQDPWTVRWPPNDPDEFTEENNLLRRMLLPPLRDGTRARLRAIVTEVVPVVDILAMFEAMVAETSEAGRRDEARWGAEQRALFTTWGRTDWNTYDEEIAYVRQWIQDRWAYLESTY